ncbi:MAG: DUF839 domain-containing protein [Actinobacteria bacterium]|nr:DUF839 domain-containing protein [Actinomycetota bacterium]
MDRRSFIQGAAAAAATMWATSRTDIVRAQPLAGDGPFGPLGPPNSDGIQLPAGFSSRLIAVSATPVAGTAHIWHGFPDGGACAPLAGGGWAYVSNGEVGDGLGEVGVIAFDAAGNVVDAYPILRGTTRNCSGGMTPWGSCLSGEEHIAGQVFECDPTMRSQGVPRPLLGTFGHEMIGVDPATGFVYLVEDHPEGRLYRFEPDHVGDLTEGTLLAAQTSPDGAVTWKRVSHLFPDRAQDTTPFNGGEGVWIMHGSMFFTTKGDVRVWRLELANQRLSIWYDAATVAGTCLTAVDNIVGHPHSSDLFVAEDGGNLEVAMLPTQGHPVVAPFLRFVGHDASEVSGLAFNPDGTRLYVSSQRGVDGLTGMVFEVSGRFHRTQRIWERLDRPSLRQPVAQAATVTNVSLKQAPLPNASPVAGVSALTPRPSRW